MKTCSKCGIEKELNEFSANKRRCKLCTADYFRAWRNGNREKVAQCQKAYRDKHATRISEVKAAWALKNKSSISDRLARYRKENTEKLRAYASAYYAANADRERARKAVARRENPHVHADRERAYRAANQDIIRAHHSKFRASERGTARIISRSTGIPINQIPEEFIKVKHAHLTLLREIRKARKK